MHNIEHRDYPENVNRNEVKASLDNYVAHADWQEGCSGLYKNIRWEAGIICPSEESAEKWLEEHDRGDYDNLAVRYRAPKGTSKKLEELQKKRSEKWEEWYKEEYKKYFADFKSTLVTCKECGSKVNVQYIISHDCPVCKADMRSNTEKKRVAALKTAEEKLESAIAAENERLAKRGEIRWLVKFEYHT